MYKIYKIYKRAPVLGSYRVQIFRYALPYVTQICTHTCAYTHARARIPTHARAAWHVRIKLERVSNSFQGPTSCRTFWNSDTRNSYHMFPNFRSLPRPLLHLQFGKCSPDISTSPYISLYMGCGERDMSKFGKLRIRLSRRRSTTKYHTPAVNWVGHNQARQAALI